MIVGALFIGMLIILMALVVTAMRNHRAKDLQDLASTLGFSYLKSPEYSQRQDATVNSRLSNRNDQRNRVFNYMTGRNDAFNIAVFDYCVGFGKSSYDQTVVCLFLPRGHLPKFAIYPKYFGSTLGLWFTGEKSVTIAAPSMFTSNYIVTGSDEQLIQEMVTPVFLNFFIQNSTAQVEGDGSRLLLYRRGATLKVDQISSWIECATDLAKELLSQQEKSASAAK